MARTLAPDQRSVIAALDVRTRELTIVHESTEVLYEAPNWSLDGADLIVNGDGHLFRLPADGSAPPARIDLSAIAELNNDHVLDPDGKHVLLSAHDGHIHRAPLAGGPARRLTPEDGTIHYLHGVSPDGRTLSLIAVTPGPEGTALSANVVLLPIADGPAVRLTDDAIPDDGAEFSPDGRWILFNSERGGTVPGHAQLFRMRPDGSALQQLTRDERVNWFPHPSPDGARLAYVSFPPGTIGHPADRDVILRECAADGTGVRDLARLPGGQGTMNVPSWSPDSRRIAFVAYPIGAGTAPVEVAPAPR